MADSSKPALSIIIVTCNSERVVSDCLTAIPAAVDDQTYELIVVDNASNDASTDIANAHNAKLIANSTNRGFAAACNQGAKAAGGENLLFLNPDVMPDPHSIATLRRTYESIDGAGLLSARLRNPDNSYQPTCRRFPTLTNLLFSRGSILSRIIGNSPRYTYGDFDSVTQVDAVAGTFVLISRDRFNLVGGFDPRFFMFMEDTDLSYRLAIAGFRNYIDPAAGGVHHWGHGSTARETTRLRYHHTSMLRYASKYFPVYQRLLLRLMLGINLTLRLIFTTRRGEGETTDG